MRYGIGARLQVQVARVDLDARKIDFRIVQDEVDAVPPRSGRRDRDRENSRRGKQQEVAGLAGDDASVSSRVVAKGQDGFRGRGRAVKTDSASAPVSKPTAKPVGKKSKSRR